MGQTIHLKLKANGKEIKGESTQKSHGRENTIECHSVHVSANAQLNPSTGLATGRRTYSPIAVSRIMDAASPLILQALCQNEKIEATFEFYRPSPTGDSDAGDTTVRPSSSHSKIVSPSRAAPARARCASSRSVTNTS